MRGLRAAWAPQKVWCLGDTTGVFTSRLWFWGRVIVFYDEPFGIILVVIQAPIISVGVRVG